MSITLLSARHSAAVEAGLRPRECKMEPKKSAVAEICLYGTSAAGSGWIACIADGTMSGKLMGNGELKHGRSMTEAVWLAADELKGAGVTRGIVRIFMAGG